MNGFRNALAFLVGLGIVIGALTHECPRIISIVVGLLLMGIFTVPEAISIFKGSKD